MIRIDYSLRRWILLFAVLLAASPVVYAERQSADELKALVTEFLIAENGHANAGSEHPLQIKVSPPDSRLRLTACSESPVVFWPNGKQIRRVVSVGVRCDDVKPWTIYMQAQLSQIRSLPVLASSVRRGEILHGGLVEYRDIDIFRQPYAASASPENLFGMEFNRSLRQGTLVARDVLRSPLMVRRGDRLTVQYKRGSILIQASAEAMANARQGERVSVKNPQSQRLYDATVIGAGLVRAGRIQ